MTNLSRPQVECAILGRAVSDGTKPSPVGLVEHRVVGSTSAGVPRSLRKVISMFDPDVLLDSLLVVVSTMRVTNCSLSVVVKVMASANEYILT